MRGFLVCVVLVVVVCFSAGVAMRGVEAKAQQQCKNGVCVVPSRSSSIPEWVVDEWFNPGYSAGEAATSAAFEAAAAEAMRTGRAVVVAGSEVSCSCDPCNCAMQQPTLAAGSPPVVYQRSGPVRSILRRGGIFPNRPKPVLRGIRAAGRFLFRGRSCR